MPVAFEAQTALRGAELVGWGLLLLTALFLAVALWNGFPLVFYDTGGYLAEGLQGAFLAERSPVYSLLLFLTGGAFSLWPMVVLQSVMTAWLIVRDRARRSGAICRWRRLLAIGAVLMLATGHRLVHGAGRTRLHDRDGRAWAPICFCSVRASLAGACAASWSSSSPGWRWPAILPIWA